MPAAEIPLFDSAAIDQLRAVAGDEDGTFVAEMAQLFLEETAKTLAELREACDQKDWKRVSRLSHGMKSAGATFGLMRFTNACQVLELDTQGLASGPETAGRVASVVEQFERALPVVRKLTQAEPDPSG